ncbi:pectate lyase [Vibrio aestuarianus]|uniref:pectate lyase n=1 Tax=Vibrio aestuarianus TaxID=28171 RepID=UPI0015592CA3|nr:pectate lyase [Vibrio aestuarianus]NGZ13700.1 pectate lyase [Vibrio aestuarianus]NKZ49848.1 pectate lyase [Vibrio aestuarianus]
MSQIRPSFLPLLTDYYQNLFDYAKASKTSLLADGVDRQTHKPINWTYPDNKQVPMSNFASQQNFLRGLVALTIITKNERYAKQAFDVTQYFLEHYVDPASGLFHWGGHRFINQDSGEIEGPASKECVHELKHHFPFYDLLHQVSPDKTERFLQGFWAAHVSDWQKLDLSRHGQYGKQFASDIFKQHTPQAVVDPAQWPKLPETIGLTFVNASTDLIYAACHYYKYTGDTDAIKWAKHLYQQFVLARHPITKMPVYQFSSPLQREPVPQDDRITYSWFGDRAKRQFGPEFGDIALEANVLFRDSWPVVVDNPLAILHCARMINDEQMAQWAIEGINAYFHYAWDEEKNEIIPMWNDAQDMTDYQFLRDGYYGEKGTTLSRQATDPAYLLPLIRASIASTNIDIRQLTCRMFARFSLGELDPNTLKPVHVASQCAISSAYLLIAILELHHHSSDDRLLSLADDIATHLVNDHYVDDLFCKSALHRYVRLDDPTPYALIALEAAHLDLYDQIPTAISTGGYLHGEQFINGELKTVYDYEVLYSQLCK